jgi:uncharacterized protein YbcI
MSATDGPLHSRIGRANSPMLEISNEMVRLYKEQFGRGPTSAHSNWAGPDTIAVVLEQTLTPAEKNLVKLGEHERLRATRMFFQYATVREFCEPVERVTGRKVRAFVSGIDTETDGLSTEIFILYTPGTDGPSRIESAPLRRSRRSGSGASPLARRATSRTSR